MKALIIVLLISFVFLVTEKSVTGQKIDPLTGFKIDYGYKTVEAYCVGCHTAKMITQNRATREEWLAIVRRMQTMAKKWKLATADEKIIVDYLFKNYGLETPNHKRVITESAE